MTTFVLASSVFFILYLVFKALKFDVYFEHITKKNVPIPILIIEMLFLFWLIFLLVLKNPPTNTFFYVSLALLVVAFITKRFFNSYSKGIFIESTIGAVLLSFAFIRTLVWFSSWLWKRKYRLNGSDRF